MWGQDKVWTHFRSDVLAAGAADAGFLMSFLRHVLSNKIHASCLDVIDLQRYKVFRTARKVKIALNNRRLDIPFIFAVGKN